MSIWFVGDDLKGIRSSERGRHSEERKKDGSAMKGKLELNRRGSSQERGMRKE